MTKFLLHIALLVGLLLVPALGWADFLAGVDTYDRGDYDTALKEWRPLAEQGYAVAQYNLGIMYHKGHGVPQDYTEAVKWFRLAADQGLVNAQYSLGQMYRKGLGVPQDYQEALKWYRRAADQGHGNAQFNLATMYYNGHGVPQDYVLAHKWADLAASQGDEDAVKKRDARATLMTPQQIAVAQRLAREWKPKGN